MKCLSVCRDPAALGGAHDIELQGDLAFVAGKGAGGHRPVSQRAPGTFGILDVRDPLHPSVIGHLLLGEEGNWAQGETVLPCGPVCFVGGSRFWAIDVSSPGKPRILKALDDPRIPSINGMVRRGNHLFAASKKNHVTVFDVREPSNPRLVAAMKPGGTAFDSPHDLARLGEDSLVVVNIKPGEPRDRLQVYRVAEGGSPEPLPTERWELVGALDDPRLAGANRVRVRGDWAFVACNKGHAVASVDLSDPRRPRTACVVPTPGRPCGLCLDGDRLLAAPGGPEGADFLEVYDVSDPSKMRLLQRESFAETTPDHDLVVRADVAWSTDGDRDLVAAIQL